MREEDQNLPEIGTTRSDCTSQSRELKEMRTGISQISDTLALLLKTLHLVAAEVATVKSSRLLQLQTGERVEETASRVSCPCNSEAASDSSHQKQDLLGTTPSGNFADAELAHEHLAG